MHGEQLLQKLIDLLEIDDCRFSRWKNSFLIVLKNGHTFAAVEEERNGLMVSNSLEFHCGSHWMPANMISSGDRRSVEQVVKDIMNASSLEDLGEFGAYLFNIYIERST